jgi:uncharacterized membrane protein
MSGLARMTFSIFVVWPLNFGVVYVCLKAARGENPKVRDMFHGFENYLNTVMANLFIFMSVVCGLVLLVVPGIFIACKLAFTPFLVVDDRMDVIGAMKKSWAMTTGHGWTIFLAYLLTLPVVFAGVIALIVGVYVSVVWIGVAYASLYYAVTASMAGDVPMEPAGEP